MNIQLIDNQIARCEGQIASLSEALPYADGGAYSQDKQRISELRTELAQWKEIRAEVAACEEFRISSNIHQANRELAEKQRDDLLKALRRLSQAALGRDATMGDQCNLIAAREELRAASVYANEVIASVQGGAE